jgi:phosphate transport system ATP-binding protein
MHDLYPGTATEGDRFLSRPDQPADGASTHRGAHAHRHGVPEAQPFPKSIYDNVAYGLRVRGEKSRT